MVGVQLTVPDDLSAHEQLANPAQAGTVHARVLDNLRPADACMTPQALTL